MTRRKRVTRVAIVCDEDCFWYVRRIAFSKYDHTRNEVTYVCDQPIGTSYDTLDEACNVAMAVQEPRRPPTTSPGNSG